MVGVLRGQRVAASTYPDDVVKAGGRTQLESPIALTRRARRINRELAELYPDAHCELDFSTPLELTVATILSAQTTDKKVNEVTPELFGRYRSRSRLRSGRPCRARDPAEADRLLPQQDQLADEARPGPGRALRRRRCLAG
ncbi:MAG: hypothetical protein WKF47_03240 [Geodermatophilaceae bacterium]